jgi:hypothetical protein
MSNNSIRQDYGLILVGAIIFTASFMWKDLLTDVEEMYFPKNGYIGYRFIFVIVITIILVTIAVYLRNYFGLNKTQNTNQSPIVFDDSPLEGGDDE